MACTARSPDLPILRCFCICHVTVCHFNRQSPPACCSTPHHWPRWHGPPVPASVFTHWERQHLVRIVNSRSYKSQPITARGPRIYLLYTQFSQQLGCANQTTSTSTVILNFMDQWGQSRGLNVLYIYYKVKI